MRFLNTSCAILAFSLFSFSTLDAQQSTESLAMDGLQQPVEIIKDVWGISHIYAQNQQDLFFAQGFNVARDRLFQLEMWRRDATGTMAEIMGEKAFKRDVSSRLFRFRGDMKQELNHYHPEGEEIITSFVKGINAYVTHVRKNTDLLPLEFRLLGIMPGLWTPEVVISRHNGLYRNVSSEVAAAKRLIAAGPENIHKYMTFQPGKPNLKLADGLDISLIPDNIFEMYNARRRAGRFGPEDIADPKNRAENENDIPELPYEMSVPEFDNIEDIGSNNWVVDGSKTFSRFPIMANDPHRSQQVPSLRYWAHLNAPGWNVIGGGEPVLPGLSIGHNEYGAWGLTIFSVDQEDLYVYETNPQNTNQYLYRGSWESMTIISESITVKGKGSRNAQLKYTRHGPVIYEDTVHNKAYAVRASWLEIGGAPYLASLRMDQAKTWEEFQEACTFSRTPSENMVWADIYGNIGWQAVGITPIRKNWYGILPVPGDGRFEWDGYLPINELPSVYNPASGYFASANENNVPHGFPYRLGYSWTDPFRQNRVKEVLESSKKFTVMDMMQLQQDELSIPARNLVPLLKGVQSMDRETQSALEMLLDWDFIMSADSREASIFLFWERNLRAALKEVIIPQEIRSSFPTPALKMTIDNLVAPDGRFGSDPLKARDELLVASLEQAIRDLKQQLGNDKSKWQYGQEKMHYIKIRHLLSGAVNDELKNKFDVGPLPRGGYSYTVNQTGGGGNQRSGASFRIIADTGNWDNSVGTNNPGQSGNPDDPQYKNLFEMWASAKYFPVLFSRDKVESAVYKKIMLSPKK